MVVYPDPLVWHYTVHYGGIVDSGAIVPTDLTADNGEHPAVWFSAEPHFEPTARKGFKAPDGTVRILRAPEEMRDAGAVAARFGVGVREAGLHTWRDHRRTSGIRWQVADALVSCARDWGANPDRWYASYDPVPLSLVRRAEVWTGERWASVYPEIQDDARPILAGD